MSKKIYIGNVENKGRNIKKIYIGDSNNKAREIIDAYNGDSINKARWNFHQHRWFMDPGAVPDCITEGRTEAEWCRCGLSDGGQWLPKDPTNHHGPLDRTTDGHNCCVHVSDTYDYCAACGANWNHTYGEIDPNNHCGPILHNDTIPDCITPEYRTEYCNACGGNLGTWEIGPKDPDNHHGPVTKENNRHSCCIHPLELWDRCDACTATFKYSTGPYDPDNHECAEKDDIYTSNNDVEPTISVYIGTHLHTVKCTGCLATLSETTENCNPDGNWITTTQPTCNSAGWQMCSCTKCGQTCYDLLPTTDHDWQYTGDYFTDMGITEYKYRCSYCGNEKWSYDNPF